MTEARHIALWRKGQGPRVVMLHGWSMTGATMSSFGAALSPWFEVLIPDLPGHGETTGYASDLSGAARLLGDLLADGKPTLLVCWSLGALVGWQYLAKSPNSVVGMVSLDMSPRPLPSPDWPYGMRGQTAESLAHWANRLELGWPQDIEPMARGLFAPQAENPPVAALAAVMAAQNAGRMARFWSSLIVADCRADLTRMPCPLLAIHGGQSQFYPPQTAAFIAATARAGRAHLLDGVGHAPHLEAPDQTVALVRAFADEVF